MATTSVQNIKYQQPTRQTMMSGQRHNPTSGPMQLGSIISMLYRHPYSLESRSFFSISGKEFLDFRESRLATAQKQAYCERDNCHLLLRTCYQLIACLLHRGCGPHTRRTDATKQRTVAYQGGRGQRWQIYLPPGADNHCYATASAQQCKCGRFSLPLYRKKKDHCSQSCVRAHVNVPTARDGNVWQIKLTHVISVYCHRISLDQ